MSDPDPKVIGMCIESARKSAGLTQAALAKFAKINRVQIVRMEAGLTIPRLDETVRLAEILKVPLSYFASTWRFPRPDLKGIAIELHHLGIKDLQVADPQVPGSFRHGEEVLAIAVSGDRPEPRVVEAIPFLLARLKLFRPALAAAFAEVHDKRAHTRLAWSCDITLALSRISTFPIPVRAEDELQSFIERTEKGSTPDSLGYPGTGRFPPIWRRWNITYAGTMDDFLRRSIECHNAFEATRIMLGDEL